MQQKEKYKGEYEIYFNMETRPSTRNNSGSSGLLKNAVSFFFVKRPEVTNFVSESPRLLFKVDQIWIFHIYFTVQG